MRVSIEEAIAIVKLKYPDARVVGIPSLSVKGKGDWYQVVSGRRISWIGQGSTIRKAWKSAAQYVVEGNAVQILGETDFGKIRKFE